jgi:hypothetical protein
LAAAAAAARAQAQRILERIFDKLSGDGFWIVPPKALIQRGQLPVRPTPSLRAAFLRAALSANPGKYEATWGGEYYGQWLPAAVASDKVTRMHRSGYYGNNLLSMTWYVIAAFELRLPPQEPPTEPKGGGEGSGLVVGSGQGAKSSSSAVAAAGAVVRKVGMLLNSYAPHLQANLNAYMAALQPTPPDEGGWGSGSNATAGCADPALPFALAAATLWDAPAAPDDLHAVDRSHCNVSSSPPSVPFSSSSSSSSSAASCYYGPEVECSQSSCNCSSTALLVRDRPQSEFLWQVDPTKLASGSDHPPDSPETVFGGAFLAPYWILRAGGLLSPPSSPPATIKEA